MLSIIVASVYMYVLRVITKRSIRDISEKRFRFFYNNDHIEPGSFIEIIDGNRKSPALVIESNPIATYKQAIRNKRITPEKIKISKTGENAYGRVMESIDQSLVAEYLTDVSKAQNSESKLVRSFFPRKFKAAPKKRAPASSDGTMAGLSLQRYTRRVNRAPATELQAYVDQVRTYFSETAKFGQGSFSYYLGFCKKIPMYNLWQIFGEVKQSRKSKRDQYKLFWWKIGQKVRKEASQEEHDSAKKDSSNKHDVSRSTRNRIAPDKKDLPF